jgi:hypothetical protein
VNLEEASSGGVGGSEDVLDRPPLTRQKQSYRWREREKERELELDEYDIWLESKRISVKYKPPDIMKLFDLMCVSL